jgi:hypothetical protein
MKTGTNAPAFSYLSHTPPRPQAVLASTFFFVIVMLLEFVHAPTDWLNGPVYYGTLYAPLVSVYWTIKRLVAIGGPPLPVTATRYHLCLLVSCSFPLLAMYCLVLPSSQTFPNVPLFCT